MNGAERRNGAGGAVRRDRRLRRRVGSLELRRWETPFRLVGIRAWQWRERRTRASGSVRSVVGPSTDSWTAIGVRPVERPSPSAVTAGPTRRTG